MSTQCTALDLVDVLRAKTSSTTSIVTGSSPRLLHRLLFLHLRLQLHPLLQRRPRRLLLLHRLLHPLRLSRHRRAPRASATRWCRCPRFVS